ncbi:cytochrome P450 [Pisolithus tinctorius]|nr:cytochrome P450 [Pisolithus tinctorius]
MRFFPSMTLSVWSIAQISAMVVGLAIMITSRIRSTRAPTYPPKVRSLLPWVGSALSFVFGQSTSWPSASKVQYGPVFQLLAGGRNIIVVTSLDSLTSVTFADHRALSSRAQHHSHVSALCSDSSLHPQIYDTIAHKIFPVLDRRLSKRGLEDITPPFARLVFDKLNFSWKIPRLSQAVPYRASVAGANGVLFGSRFPQDTYEDFFTLLDSLPKRLCKRPFWSLPFTALFREHNIPIKVAARSVLMIMSSLHQNTVNIVFWLFAWLLADSSAFSAVRDEIDKATFIAEASLEKLDSPAFALLNSAILETMRLATVQSGMREATCDLVIKDGERTIPIRKGDYVLLDPRGTHLDKNLYPEGDSCGKHTCKGRFLAIYEIKVLAIIYLSLFDITPSAGTVHPKEDVFVRLYPRFVL